MSRHTATLLPDNTCYDDCLLSACLKSLFSKATKARDEHSFKISKHVEELKSELDQINDGRILEMSYAYLEAMERSLKGGGFRYAVIYKGGVPVLFTYFQLLSLTSGNFRLEKNSGFVKGILRFFLDLKKVKVLVAGNTLRHDTACVAYNEAILNKAEATEIAISVAEKVASQECTTAVILKDILFSAPTKKMLGRMGYHMPWEDKVMVLGIDRNWGDLDGYLNSLSRKYKTRANKILGAASNLEVRSLSEEEIVKREREIGRLFHNVTEYQTFVLNDVKQDHFTALKKMYGNDFDVVGFFNGDKMVAFYSAFISEDALEMYYVGLDYEQNEEHQLYFNLLFSGLRQAILMNKKQLKLGRTSFDAKASIGAKPVDVDYLIKTTHLPNAVLRWFTNYFSSLESGKWKLRNPLKSMAGEVA